MTDTEGTTTETTTVKKKMPTLAKVQEITFFFFFFFSTDNWKLFYRSIYIFFQSLVVSGWIRHWRDFFYMKLVKNIVSKEGIYSKRVQPLFSQSYYPYYFNNTLINNNIAGCTYVDYSTNKYYSIIFPFDSFITDTIEITTYPGYRYPMKIDIQGTGDRQNFYHLANETGDHLCSSYSTNTISDCQVKTSLKIKIPKDVYKGFKIILDGKDNRDSYQLCIGEFEVYGTFVKERMTCNQNYCNNRTHFFVLIVLTIYS